jgi:hypothetical protein
VIRRLLTIGAWLVAVLMLVVAVGTQVRRHRQADPLQALQQWVPWVPDGLDGRAALMAQPTPTSAQIAVAGDRAWLAEFLGRNRFEASDTQVSGLAARRFILDGGLRPGAIIQVLVPGDGSPVLITAMAAPTGGNATR